MKWKIRDKIYNLPFDTKEQVLDFVNTDIRTCPHCSKIDCSLEHVSNCDEQLAHVEELRRENLWK